MAQSSWNCLLGEFGQIQGQARENLDAEKGALWAASLSPAQMLAGLTSPGDSPLHCLQDEDMPTHDPDVRQLIGSFKVPHSSGSGMAVSSCLR